MRPTIAKTAITTEINTCCRQSNQNHKKVVSLLKEKESLAKKKRLTPHSDISIEDEVSAVSAAAALSVNDDSNESMVETRIQDIRPPKKKKS